MNLFSLAKAFPTEEHALAYWIKTRWPNGVRCLACDSSVYLIKTKSKPNRKGDRKPVRLFECSDCGLHFSPTAGTLFHDSHLSLQKWFMAIALMVEAKKGVSANQIKRHIGCTYKTAWYLCHRIRQAMQESNPEPMGSGGQVVEIDEMRVGGKRAGTGVKDGLANKTEVLGIVERGGRVHLQTIPNTKKETVQPILDARISPNAEHIVTDGASRYTFMVPKDKHRPGNHKEERKARQRVSNQTVEGAFSLFKRGVIGSYHQLGPEHLDRYLGEFCWRYNRRRMQPWMFDMALTSLAENKPMPYKELTKF